MDSGAEGCLGCWSPEEKAAPADGQICDVVKPDVERKTGKDYKVFQAIVCRTQVVAGTNYLIKVHVGGEDYVHILVFEALPCNGGKKIMEGVQTGKTRDDPLEPFPPKN